MPPGAQPGAAQWSRHEKSSFVCQRAVMTEHIQPTKVRNVGNDNAGLTVYGGHIRKPNAFDAGCLLGRRAGQRGRETKYEKQGATAENTLLHHLSSFARMAKFPSHLYIRNPRLKVVIAAARPPR